IEGNESDLMSSARSDEHSEPFSALLKLFEKNLRQNGRRSDIQTMSCATSHCYYDTFLLITTSCELWSPFLPLWGEPQGFGFPTGRTPDDHQAPGLEGLQT